MIEEEIILPTEYHELVDGEVVFNKDRFIKEYVKPRRNNLLAFSDWTQLPDASLTNEQKVAYQVYRQELRDFTHNIHDEINSLDDITFPKVKK